MKLSHILYLAGIGAILAGGYAEVKEREKERATWQTATGSGINGSSSSPSSPPQPESSQTNSD